MSAKSEHKRRVKEGARQFLSGDGSAWAAHKGRRCIVGCHYCQLTKRMFRKTNEETPSKGSIEITGAQA